jgi:hypothetical protein
MRSSFGLGCLLLWAAGCSSSSSPSDGGAPQDATSTEGGGEAAPPAEAAGGDDSASDGPTVCNTLVNEGQPVTPVQVASAPPAFAGGTVADGTYVLTGQTIYTGDGGATGPTTPTQRITIQLQGSTFQVSKDSDPPTSTYAFAPTGATYVATGECPPLLGDLAGSYTATATTFTVSLGAPGSDGGGPETVDSFTKQ